MKVIKRSPDTEALNKDARRSAAIGTGARDLRIQLAVARESMRGLANGTQQLVLFGGRGCLTDDCTHWDDRSCNRKDPYCRIGRTVEIVVVKEQKP